jgi:vacuolar-type H+-ATPase subunit E/Vma4
MGTACAVDSNKNFVKKDGEQFIIEAVGFFNSLLYMLKDDLSTRTSLQKELIAARIPDIVEKAKNLGTDGRLQIRAEQFLLEIADETYYRKLENVNELVVAVESKLQGLPSQSNFAHIIRMLNTLAEETVLHET